MSDYAIIQVVQQIRILLETGVIPLVVVGLVSFTIYKSVKAKAGKRLKDLEKRVFELETQLKYETKFPELKDHEKRLIALEDIVVNQELEKQ